MPEPLATLFSLEFLKAFVAVGRRMSITLAAEDLCLTQSAVSRQIRSLEDQVGVKLFVRKQRGVGFTAEGERLFRTADQAILQLQEIATEVRRGDAPHAVTVTASIGVAGLWLLPRLGRLQQLYPRLDVRLSASNHLNDLRADGVDLAIRYCKDTAAPPRAIRLFEETIMPVAHPSILAVAQRAEDVVSSHPLLEFEDSRPWLQWRRWLGDAAWKKARRGVIRFNQYDQVIQAALAGQGLALGRLELIQPLIESRQLALLQLPTSPVISPNSYWLVQAHEQPREEVLRVAQWIQAEARGVRRPARNPVSAAAVARERDEALEHGPARR